MAKKGLTDALVHKREQMAYAVFQGRPAVKAAWVLSWLRSCHDFGMRLGRLYQIQRMAKESHRYIPKLRKQRKDRKHKKKPSHIDPLTKDDVKHALDDFDQWLRNQKKPREEVDVAQREVRAHPALAQARKLLEDAGFVDVRIYALLPVQDGTSRAG